MAMNIILGATLYPSLFLVYLIVKGQVFKNNNMIFGVRLPEELRESEAVKEITSKYHKQMKLFLFVYLLSPILCFLSHHTSIQFSIWMFWFLSGIFLMNAPYVLANKAAQALKDQITIQDPETPEKKDILYAELKTVRTVKTVSFLIPILVSVLPVIILFLSKTEEAEIFRISALVFAMFSPCYYLVARWMDRLPSLVISADSAVNVSYNRARKNIWKKVWLFLTWLNALVVVVIAVSALTASHSLGSFLLSTILEAFLGIFSLLWASRKIRLIEEAYAVKKEEIFDQDDDRYWIFGMIYNNPHDKRSMVEKRFGIGLTTNMATRTGKVTLIVAFLALIWIPFMCLWLIVEEFTPMHVIIRDDAVVCSHLKDDYVIPITSIEEVTLLTEAPLNRHKISGTGTDTMEKGKYNAGKIGGYYSYINPERETFLLIEAEKGKYLISGYTDVETETVYEYLTE